MSLPFSNLLNRSRSRGIHEAFLIVFVGQAFVLFQEGDTLLKIVNPDMPRWASLTMNQILANGFDYLFLCGALVFLGMMMIFVADRKLRRLENEPVDELTACVESAAAGDVSRLPAATSGRLSRLSGAIKKLITVVSRSEDLVYHLSSLIENSGEAIVSLKLDGTITTWNKGAQRIYGYAVNEVQGKPVAVLSPAEGWSELQQQLQLIRSGEKIQPFEMSHKARNGRTVSAFVRMAGIFDSRFQLIGISFCVQDLTEIPAPKQTQIGQATDPTATPQ